MSKNFCALALAWLTLCRLFSGIARAATTVAASESPFTVEVWGMEDGLPGSSVLSLVQTHDGYLWLATLYGLARFDGVKFTVFDEANTPGLSSIRIVHLFEDSRTNLWVGTESAGITLIERDGQIKTLGVGADARAIHPIAACEDANKTVWSLMKDGRLFRFQNGKLEFLSGGF